MKRSVPEAIREVLGNTTFWWKLVWKPVIQVQPQQQQQLQIQYTPQWQPPQQQVVAQAGWGQGRARKKAAGGKGGKVQQQGGGNKGGGQPPQAAPQWVPPPPAPFAPPAPGKPAKGGKGGKGGKKGGAQGKVNGVAFAMSTFPDNHSQFGRSVQFCSHNPPNANFYCIEYAKGTCPGNCGSLHKCPILKANGRPCGMGENNHHPQQCWYNQ